MGHSDGMGNSGSASSFTLHVSLSCQAQNKFLFTNSGFSRQAASTSLLGQDAMPRGIGSGSRLILMTQAKHEWWMG